MQPIFKIVRKDTLEGWAFASPDEQKKLWKHLEKYKPGTELILTIKQPRKHKMRSLEQNAYYWGVIIKTLSLEWYGSEDKDDMEAVHDGLKNKFLAFDLGVFDLKASVSTTKLDTKQWEMYMRAIRTWASVDCNIYIPLPNEVEGIWNNGANHFDFTS